MDVITYFFRVGLGLVSRELTLLYLGHASDKVVEALGLGLGAEDGEGQIMVLEIQTDSW